jgi:spermidine synthase
MHVVIDDARRFLRRANRPYEVIFLDVFHGIRCIPSHLTTREFFELIRRGLDDGGVLVVNVISAIEGRNSRMLKSLLKTVDAVFPNRALFLTLPNQDPSLTQNVVVVASVRDLQAGLDAAAQLPASDPVHALLGGYRAKSDYDISGGLVFTDEWNPAEYLAAQMLHP